MSKFWVRIISFSSLETDSGFDSEDSETKFDRARSTPGNSLLKVLRAIFIYLFIYLFIIYHLFMYLFIFSISWQIYKNKKSHEDNLYKSYVTRYENKSPQKIVDYNNLTLKNNL